MVSLIYKNRRKKKNEKPELLEKQITCGGNMDEMGEGDQKTQTSSYKKNNFWGYTVKLCDCH